MFIPTGRELINSEEIIKKLGLKKGAIAADLGCGTSGHFIFPAARLVGEGGKVYAVDILQSALSSIESKAKMQNLGNIEEVWADIEVADGVKISEESCDAVFLINVRAKPEMLREALRLLKKDGKLLIIDWRTDSIITFGPKTRDRVSQEEIKKRVKEFNLSLVEEFDAGPQHWGLIYKK